MNLDWLEKRIQKAGDADVALRDAARELCKAFNADRMTLYRVAEDNQHLVGVVQMGLESFDAMRVRITTGRSVAGHVAAARRTVNIGDTFNEKELAPLEMKMKLFRAMDERTGYRTQQVLAAPVISLTTGRLLGVVEFLNRVDHKPFPKSSEGEIEALSGFIAKAFEKARAAV